MPKPVLYSQRGESDAGHSENFQKPSFRRQRMINQHTAPIK
jgi:hypothetical protein